MQPHSSLSQGLSLLDGASERERSGRPGYSVSRLADAVGVERSRASRLTQELRLSGYLELDEAQALRPSSSYFRVAASVNTRWLRSARRELRSLASRFGVSARVTARAGAAALLLRYETGVGASDTAVRPGMTMPVWCTGAGRALLWDLEAEQVRELLSDVVLVGVGGPRAAHSPAEVVARLEQDRLIGHVFAEEEYEQGVNEWAFPLVSTDGSVVAAVSAVSRPLTERAEAALVAALGAASERIRELLRAS